jgi:hypothetical protein
LANISKHLSLVGHVKRPEAESGDSESQPVELRHAEVKEGEV